MALFGTFFAVDGSDSLKHFDFASSSQPHTFIPWGLSLPAHKAGAEKEAESTPPNILFIWLLFVWILDYGY